MQRLKVLMAAAVLWSVCLCAGSHAAEMSTSQLRALLDDMGYKPAMEGEMVKVDGLATSKLAMYFILSEDHSLLTVEVTGYDIEPNQAAAIPAAAML